MLDPEGLVEIEPRGTLLVVQAEQLLHSIVRRIPLSLLALLIF